MIAAAGFAGIPIALPGWLQVVSYLLLVLLALGIVAAVWRTVVIHKQNGLLAETHAKTNLILMILRGWQQGTPGAQNIENEHYAVDPERTPIRSALAPNDEHGRFTQ